MDVTAQGIGWLQQGTMTIDGCTISNGGTMDDKHEY